MYWKNIIPVFLVHAFNAKRILFIVNYIIISNIHNITPKSGILFTDICIRDFFNKHDFMKDWVEVIFYYYFLFIKYTSYIKDSDSKISKIHTRFHTPKFWSAYATTIFWTPTLQTFFGIQIFISDLFPTTNISPWNKIPLY